jgi:hypothetical protein
MKKAFDGIFELVSIDRYNICACQLWQAKKLVVLFLDQHFYLRGLELEREMDGQRELEEN